MKKTRFNFFTVLLIMILTFWPGLQFSHGASGEVPRPEECWPIYPPENDIVSAYLEILNAYALPPAWGNLDPGQEGAPTDQLVCKWEARAIIKAFNIG